MTDSVASSPQPAPLPRVSRKPKRNLGWVWLIPILAALIGLSIVWKEWSSKGPVITISFASAAGLEQGKTQVRFKEVIVGMVTGIRLSQDSTKVVVDVQLNKEAQGLANEGTNFWVVKPTIGVTGISGLATLLSGSYIEADTTHALQARASKTQFVGLERPPPISSDRPGSRFKLRAPSLGSLQSGTPIYFLRIPVGVVTDYTLDPSGHFVDIDVFIDSPYDKYVNGSTRFWNESGIYVNVGAEGLTVQTESMVSILTGGIAFATFGDTEPLGQENVFKLYDSRKAAGLVPIGIGVPVKMRFEQSTRGLEVGAPIDFRGVRMGTVDSIALDVDPVTRRFYTLVEATVYPARLGRAFEHLPEGFRTLENVSQLVAGTVRRGMRAQLQTASLITGGVYIAFVYRPDAPLPDNYQASVPIIIPTAKAESLEDLQAQISSIVASVQKIPFETIGKDLDKALQQLIKLTQDVNTTLTPELTTSLKSIQKTLSEIDRFIASGQSIPSNIDRSIRELDRTVQSTRMLIDEVRQKPNSLIFGDSPPSYSRENLGVTGP